MAASMQAAQLNDIRSEIENEYLISPPEQLSRTCSLVIEYASDDVFLPKVLSLFERGGRRDGPPRYSHIRYVRRDGNCFYRSASFGYFEMMLLHPSLVDEFLLRASELRGEMLRLFGEFSADFCLAAEKVATDIRSGAIKGVPDLHEALTSKDSEYTITFFRYAVSVHLRSHETDFVHFLADEYSTVKDYCTAEVEPVAHETDQLQLVAFAQLFDLRINVEYLDRSAGASTTAHVINSDCSRLEFTIYVLYRPGHYDLLYL